jgi:hypothetical protein
MNMNLASFFKELKYCNKIISRVLIFCLFLGAIGAGSMKLEKDEVEVTGKVYIMGNEPFTHVAIKLDDGQVYALVGEKAKELRGLQGKRLSVIGKPSEEKPRGAKAIEVKSYKIMGEK